MVSIRPPSGSRFFPRLNLYTCWQRAPTFCRRRTALTGCDSTAESTPKNSVCQVQNKGMQVFGRLSSRPRQSSLLLYQATNDQPIPSTVPPTIKPLIPIPHPPAKAPKPKSSTQPQPPLFAAFVWPRPHARPRCQALCNLAPLHGLPKIYTTGQVLTRAGLDASRLIGTEKQVVSLSEIMQPWKGLSRSDGQQAGSADCSSVLTPAAGTGLEPQCGLRWGLRMGVHAAGMEVTVPGQEVKKKRCGLRFQILRLARWHCWGGEGSRNREEEA